MTAKPLRLSRGTDIQSLGLPVKPNVHAIEPVDSTVRDRKQFGERVLRARLEFGARQKPPRSVSQSEVGGVLGVTGVAVGSWEAGRKIPDLGTIQKLAFVLGVRAAWLAFGEEPIRLGEGSAPPPAQDRQHG